MNLPNKVIAVLPAYNEEKDLPVLLKNLEAAFTAFNVRGEIVVVNDGSVDSTGDIARNYKSPIPITVIDHNPNKGLAEAMKTGFNHVAKTYGDDDLVLTMDSDNTHNSYLMHRMVLQILEGSDVVIASRYQVGARILGLTQIRKFYSWVASYLFRIFVGLEGVKDYTCGFRVYRLSLLKRAVDHYGPGFIEQKGFGVTAEILLKLARFKPIVNEVPMILRYDLKSGDSKMQVGRTIKQTLRMLYKYRFS